MQKVDIKPKAMSMEQALVFFKALSPADRREFYNSLGCDAQDTLYERATDTLIARVHLTTKNRIDAQRQKKRNAQRGYILPDECHTAEDTALWKSAAWSLLIGHDTESLLKNLPHMQPHFQALCDAQE